MEEEEGKHDASSSGFTPVSQMRRRVPPLLPLLQTARGAPKSCGSFAARTQDGRRKQREGALRALYSREGGAWRSVLHAPCAACGSGRRRAEFRCSES